MAYSGQGTAVLKGFVVFVRRAVPGDMLAARFSRKKMGQPRQGAQAVIMGGGLMIMNCKPLAGWVLCGETKC